MKSLFKSLFFAFYKSFDRVELEWLLASKRP